MRYIFDRPQEQLQVTCNVKAADWLCSFLALGAVEVSVWLVGVVTTFTTVLCLCHGRQIANEAMSSAELKSVARGWCWLGSDGV